MVASRSNSSKSVFFMSILGTGSVEGSMGREMLRLAARRTLYMRAAMCARPKRLRVWLSDQGGASRAVRSSPRKAPLSTMKAVSLSI